MKNGPRRANNLGGGHSAVPRPSLNEFSNEWFLLILHTTEFGVEPYMAVKPPEFLTTNPASGVWELERVEK